jgi:hypothetical protein
MRPSFELALVGTVVACTPPPQAARERTSTTSIQATAEPVSVQVEPPAEGPADNLEQAAPALSRRAPELLVGLLGQNGTYVCSRGGPPEGEWIGIYPEVGFVPLLATARVRRQVDALLGRMVVARGSASRQPVEPAPIPADREPCTQLAQMRSDWEARPGGFRIRRGPPLGIAAFRAVALEEFTGLEADAQGAQLELRLTNTLGQTLVGPITLRVHYEGCYGKPGTLSRSEESARSLPPGATVRASFPTTVTELLPAVRSRAAERHAYRAHSAQVLAQAPEVHFDLDAPLHVLGASVKCP